MHIVLDLLLAAIILFSLILGYKRGFVKSLLGAIRFIAALLAALLLSGPLSVPICDKIVYPAVSKTLDSSFEQFEGGDELLALLDDGSAKISEALDRFCVSREEASAYAEKSAEKGEEGTAVRDGFIRMVAEPLAKRISVGIAFSAVFLFAFLLLWILQSVFDIVSKLPGLHQINQIFGVLFGLVSGMILVCVLVSFLSYLWPILSEGNPSLFPVDTVERSYLFRFLSEHNLLSAILDKIA